MSRQVDIGISIAEQAMVASRIHVPGHQNWAKDAAPAMRQLTLFELK